MTMKITHLIKVLILIFVLSSCKKDKVVIEGVAVKADSVTVPFTEANTTADIIKKLIDSKKQVQAKLSSLSSDEANLLYEKFRQQNDTLISKLTGKESHILDNYYTYFTTGEGEPIAPPDSIAKKVNFLSSAQLELWPIGEGYVDIRLAPDYYYSLFKNYVSDDYKQFLELEAKDEEVLYSADAGLSISFNDLGKRVINWENFITKNPYSKLFPQALQIYKGYQYDYLLGMDNTPTFAIETNTFYPENITEFKQFIAKHPNSKTVVLIKVALSFKGTKDELYAFIEKEQQRLIDKIVEDATPDYQ
jgi:hypothetical protein